jgi:DNA polymerase-4
MEAGRLAKQIVQQVSGLTCSVGISGDKTTAKYAAKKDKPNGLFSVSPWYARTYLSDVPVTELSGIAKGIGRYLNQRGVYVCGDMQNLPISELARRFGNLGRRIWYMAQGLDPDPIQQEVAAPKSVGHSKVMPPNTSSFKVLKVYLHHMAEKVATRLRRHEFEARTYFVGYLTENGWVGDKLQTEMPTNDSHKIKTMINDFLQQVWRQQGCFQVRVVALDPKDQGCQMGLFDERDVKRQQINCAMDHINQRYGEFTLTSANLLQRSEMPNVIAPAWKPYGHRKTV